jgi:hypothetical protein
MVEWQASIDARRAARKAEREARRQRAVEADQQLYEALQRNGGIITMHWRTS